MTSHSPRRCCIVGVAHTGKPRGTIQHIAGVRSYVVHPSSGSTSHAVVLMTDALGMDFINTQLIADQLAANNYLTVVPDVLGDAAIPFPPPATFDLDAWCANTMPRPATVDPLYAAVIAHLRAEMGITRIGGVGYCFGAKYVCRFLSLPSPSPSPSPSLSAASSYPPSPSPALDAGFIAHPSFVTASEVERVAAPLSIAAAQHDDIFPADKRRETEDILAQLPGVPYQITLYSHVEHGFATKGDLAGERARWAKERAFAQAVEWLDEFVRKE